MAALQAREPSAATIEKAVLQAKFASIANVAKGDFDDHEMKALPYAHEMVEDEFSEQQGEQHE